MISVWKVILTIFILYAISVDASPNRARRRRRHVVNDNAQSNSLNLKPEARQQPLAPNPQMSNSQGKNFGNAQGSRQYGMPNQYGGWSGGMQGQYNPYQSYGSSGYQNYGQYNPNVYGSQFYQNPSYSGSYGGYGSNSNYMNRPGYSNYNPSYGGYSGGYFWNSAPKSTISVFHILLTAFVAIFIGSTSI